MKFTQQLVSIANTCNIRAVCCACGKIRDRFDFIMDSYSQKIFKFVFGSDFFQIILLLFFQCLFLKFFCFLAPIMTATVYVKRRPKVDIVCFQKT